MFRRTGIIVSLLLMIAAINQPAEAQTGQQVRRELQWEGIARSYYIYVPTGYNPQASHPLVLVLHGSGGNAVRQADKTQYAAKAEAENFIVVHANGHPANVSPAQQLPDGNYEWNARQLPPPDDAAFLNKVIDEVEATHNIDKNRVYMSGFSNGASMTSRMSCEFTSRFAAMAPVSGNWAFGADGRSGIADFDCTPTSPIPIMYFRGTAESSIPTRDNEDPEFEQFWSRHNGCDAAPVVDTVYVNGDTITRERYMNCTGGNAVTIMNVEGNSHGWHASATDETWNFLKGYRKDVPPPTGECAYDFAPLTNFIQNRVASQPLQGASLLILRDGKVIYERAFGGYTLETRVPIASATKWVSASVIMSLIDDGTLSLDDKVSRYINSFTGDKANITLRQLLSHTSGLPGEDLGCLGDENTTLAQCADLIGSANLIAEPGTKFAYGGNSFQVAGRIAEVATGKTWDQLFQERTRNLLNMTATDYGYLSTASGYATMTNPRIAGGIRSTLRDYGNFVLMHNNKGVFDHRRVLSENIVNLSQIDQTFGAPIINSPSPVATSYGLGQFRDIVDAQGNAIQLSSQGAFGFSPWIDKQRGLACVFLVQDQFRRVSSFVTEMQGMIRDTVDRTACNRVPTIQFAQASINAAENAASGTVDLTVLRSGDMSQATTVGFVTNDDQRLFNCDPATEGAQGGAIRGVATARCDYSSTVGTLSFAAGETTKTISIAVTDDVHVEGAETFSISLRNPTGGALGATTTAIVTLQDTDAAGQANPIADNAFFVRQHYLDFFGRNPGPDEIATWTRVIAPDCGLDAPDACYDRIWVSGKGFFESTEFQQKGYFVYRFYKLLGRNALPTYNGFIPDMVSMRGAGDADKNQFAQRFVARADYAAIYNNLSNADFVDILVQRTGLTSLNAAQMKADLANNTKTRGQLLIDAVESAEMKTREFTESWVVMQYFGYLRRDGTASEYKGWVDYLAANPTKWRQMINGFANSIEYRQRFGTP